MEDIMKRKTFVFTLVLCIVSALCVTAYTAGSGKTIITMASSDVKNDISIIITSANGTVIALDPMKMPNGSKPDIILVTHFHHYNGAYLDKYPNVKKIEFKAEKLNINNITVAGIAASHSAAPIDYKHPDYIFYVLNIDGLRMAYFACLGQKKFTASQMKALGKIDIAFITADTEAKFFTAENAALLMKQLNPRIIIPLSHHFTDLNAGIKTMNSIGAPVENVTADYAVSKKDLDNGKQKIVRINKK
jgi:L-ascorbate metabolism protein UlaG (beta-lactamase superfamily)